MSLHDIVIPGLGVVSVTPASRTPEFELHCVRCGEGAGNPMWWDAGDGAWYCGAHGWVANPAGTDFVLKARVRNSPVWMPRRVGFDLEFELDFNMALGRRA